MLSVAAVIDDDMRLENGCEYWLKKNTKAIGCMNGHLVGGVVGNSISCMSGPKGVCSSARALTDLMMLCRIELSVAEAELTTPSIRHPSECNFKRMRASPALLQDDVANTDRSTRDRVSSEHDGGSFVARFMHGNLDVERKREVWT